MTTLLQIQLYELTLITLWGVLSIISSIVLFSVWDNENKEEGDDTTLLTYIGAGIFGTLMAPIISTIALIGWLGTITPAQAKKSILHWVSVFKESIIGHWRWGKPVAKQAPPTFSVGTGSGILVHQNPPSTFTTIHSGPYINDMMNVKTRNTISFVGHPVPSMGRGVGPNRMTRMSNGSGAPNWYVPKAKKANP
jgi:hypothetical protein